MATASGPVSGPAAAQAVLGGLRQVAGALGRSAGQPWWRLSEEQVGEVMGLMGVIRHQLDRVEVAAAREGIDRGLHTDQGWSATDWVRRTEADSAPAPATGHAARVSRVAQSAGRAEVSGVHQAVAAGVLSVGRADQLIRFQAEVAPVADPDLLEIDLQVLLDAASDHLVEPDRPGGPTRACRLSDRELGVALARTARMLKPEEDLERQEERQRTGRMLFKRAAQAGMTEYRWVLDPEGAAVVDSAISGLSAPAPAKDGTPDTRSAAQRRAEALLAVVQRGVSSPGKGPRTDKAQVVVTITMHDLLQGLHGAGVTTTGTVLSRPPCAGWPARPGSSRWCSAPRARSSTWATPPGCSPGPNVGRCGTGTAGAPSRTAPSRPSGARPTMSTGGPVAAPPTWPTGPCSAHDTTPTSTNGT